MFRRTFLNMHSYRRPARYDFELMLAVCIWLCCAAAHSSSAERLFSTAPNIVIVLTDDQGYGDIAALGNPIVQTPHLDDLYEQSVRFTDFHVDPTCSPTRAALMTGQHSMRAGVWHTIMGRSLLPPEKTTLAEALRHLGYRTGIFGKWHLGDNYPYRATDQGFQHVVVHGGGGVGQTPDYWGNVQFDDTYFVNNTPRTFSGNSTDVWFDEAEAFLREGREQPTFALIALNAPHRPWRAPIPHIQPYLSMGLPMPMAKFYAMISHLDARIGHLREVIADLSRPTVLVFLSDNGSAFSFSEQYLLGDPDKVLDKLRMMPGAADWAPNAGMRGFKGSVYEGGHRTPLFVWYPGVGGGRDVDVLAAHFDIFPTLLDLAGVKFDEAELDGKSLARYVTGAGEPDSTTPRSIVVTNQRVFIPKFERPAAVLTERWRYVVHGEEGLVELFDIKTDPSQSINVASAHPETVQSLQAELEAWWAPYSESRFQARAIPIGVAEHGTVRLTAMDWMEAPSTDAVPWFPNFPPDQSTVPFADSEPSYARWIGREAEFEPLPWYVDAEHQGDYEVELWFHDRPARRVVNRALAVLEADRKRQTLKLPSEGTHASFRVTLSPGFHRLRGWFTDSPRSTNRLPAFYMYIRPAHSAKLSEPKEP